MKYAKIFFIIFLAIYSCKESATTPDDGLVTKINFTATKCLDSDCKQTYTYQIDSAKVDDYIATRLTFTGGFRTGQRIEIAIARNQVDTVMHRYFIITDELAKDSYYHFPGIKLVKHGRFIAHAKVFEKDSIIWSDIDSLYVLY